MAPPKELKKMVKASVGTLVERIRRIGKLGWMEGLLPVGMSFAVKTTCTAIKGICIEAPAPIPVKI